MTLLEYSYYTLYYLRVLKGQFGRWEVVIVLTFKCINVKYTWQIVSILTRNRETMMTNTYVRRLATGAESLESCGTALFFCKNSIKQIVLAFRGAKARQRDLFLLGTTVYIYLWCIWLGFHAREPYTNHLHSDMQRNLQRSLIICMFRNNSSLTNYGKQNGMQTTCEAFFPQVSELWHTS